jgi:hypothetical protein
MFVTVTLNSQHGISLGPRFFLSSNVGEPVPAEATLSELLAGKVIEVPDSATQIEVASNGACTNSLVLNIGSVPTTTTTTTTTTTAAPTTTTAAPTTTTAAPTTTTAAPFDTTTTAAPTTTTAAPTTTSTTTSGGGPACGYGDGLTIVCDATTTTTTTAAPVYDYLRCDVYSCTGGGTLLEEDVIVRILEGSPIPSQFSSFRWYYTTPFDGKAYYLTSTSVAGPFYDATVVNNPQTSRSSACSVGASVTTTTTTSTTTTTTTTTTAAPVCNEYRIENNTETSVGISYYDCSGTYQEEPNLGSGQQITFCASTTYGAIEAGGATLFTLGTCVIPTYDLYEATQYECGTRDAVGTTIIAFPTGTSVNYSRFYNSDTDLGTHAYQPYATSLSGPGLIMNTIAYITIPLACPI